MNFQDLPLDLFQNELLGFLDKPSRGRLAQTCKALDELLFITNTCYATTFTTFFNFGQFNPFIWAVSQGNIIFVKRLLSFSQNNPREEYRQRFNWSFGNHAATRLATKNVPHLLEAYRLLGCPRISPSRKMLLSAAEGKLDPVLLFDWLNDHPDFPKQESETPFLRRLVKALINCVWEDKSPEQFQIKLLKVLQGLVDSTLPAVFFYQPYPQDHTPPLITGIWNQIRHKRAGIASWLYLQILSIEANQPVPREYIQRITNAGLRKSLYYAARYGSRNELQLAFDIFFNRDPPPMEPLLPFLLLFSADRPENINTICQRILHIDDFWSVRSSELFRNCSENDPNVNHIPLPSTLDNGLRNKKSQVLLTPEEEKLWRSCDQSFYFTFTLNSQPVHF